MDLRRISYLCLPVLALLLAGAAKSDPASVSFISDAQLRYAMDFADAQSRFSKGDKDWVVLYNVDTPSTNEFAWVFQEREFYMLRFYQGSCYFIERRVEIPAPEVERVFQYFTELNGETPEGTMSRDQSLWYSHWMLKDRDVELTAAQREGETYLLTYQEFDPMLLGEALRVQEGELASQPSEVDPITGKPRPSTHEASGEEGTGEGTNPENSGQEGQPEGDQPEEAPPPPPPDDDEPDWY